MNGYIAFFREKRMEVNAETSLAARKIATKAFKARQEYFVTVVLAELDGEPVLHSGEPLP